MIKAAMPFQSDNTWPTGLQTIFNHGRAKRTTFEDRYYGPYDKLLNYCFGGSFTFYIAPQNPPRDDSRDVFDPTVFLVVFDSNDKPVLIVEAKDDSWIEKAELRYRADDQMRSRYALMLTNVLSPVFGASAFSAPPHASIVVIQPRSKCTLPPLCARINRAFFRQPF
jgi:hypothetical protein